MTKATDEMVEAGRKAMAKQFGNESAIPYYSLAQVCLTAALAAQPGKPEPSEAEKRARRKLAKNGRNEANWYAGISSGSDLHLCEMLLKDIDNLRALFPPPAQGERDERQRVVVEWGARCFGAEHMADKIVRAARFFEEAAELVQAVGLPHDHAMRAFNHVYSRAPGDPKQEAGGSGVTLMALCSALGLSAEECERVEVARCLSKDPAHFAERNKQKLACVDAEQPAQGERERALEEAAKMAETLARGQAVELGVGLNRERHPLGSMCADPCDAQRATAQTIAAAIRSLASPSPVEK